MSAVLSGRVPRDAWVAPVGATDWWSLADIGPAFGLPPSAAWPVAAPALTPASVGVRAVAWLVDAVLATLVTLVAVRLVDGFRTRSDIEGWWTTELNARGILAALCVTLALQVVPVAVTGRTVGKAVVGIRVVPAADAARPVGFGRALGRVAVINLFALLCVVPAIVDHLAALWDPEARTWHDRIAGTRVIVGSPPGRS